MAFAFQARWLLPMVGEPIADGVLTVEGNRIRSIGTSPPSDCDTLDFGNAAILPGWTNAHTHLEFALDTPLPARDSFADWIRSVIRWRIERAETGVDVAQAIRQNLEASLDGGATTLGEIATLDFQQHPMCEGRVNGVVFRELLGLGGEREQEQHRIAERHFSPNGREPTGTASGTLVRGLSPHAPYTVSPDLVREACRLSRAQRVPLAMHLAESVEELELLQSHSGPLVELLRDLDAWDSSAVPRGIRPADYLELLSESDRALVVHGNFLTRDEIAFVAANRDRMSVVYCPRTFAHFGHGRYPLAEMLEAGVRVVIGTDSRASNPDLSLLAELQFAFRQHDLPARRWLEMVTLDAAESLGLQADQGTLAAGKRADLVVVKLPEHDDESPWDLVLDEHSQVTATFVGGRGVRREA